MNKKFWQKKKVLVTGGHGFVGRHLVDRLKELQAQVFTPFSKDCDLRDKRNCQRVVQTKDIVIHLAAKVGGIGFNQKYPGEMFYDNILMGVNLLEEARVAGVKKFVTIGTVCSYPKFTSVPFKEKDLWDGYPEETNAAYGLAKKMLLVQEQAYRKQYGFNSIYLIPINMYGPGDKFDPEVSHVIPALVRKVIEAKSKGAKEIVVWGSGRATRGFLYVEDAVEGMILAAEKYNKEDPVNLGSAFEISIKELTKLICKIAGFSGKIVWDRLKPDGQPRRRLDVSTAFKEFGFKAKTPFIKGLEKTISWYRKG